MSEENYLNIMEDIRTNGSYREGRNGGTYGVFGRQMRFDLSEGFPLLLTKRVHFKSILVELLWFIKGMTNVDYLHKHGVTIWDEWADSDGELGPVYGAQWRGFGAYNQYGPASKIPGEGEDQLKQVIEGIKKDPYSRRHIVSAWNPLELYAMALPPCHTMFQFYVDDGKLSCHLYQRSADWFLGVPFNIASYALLTHLVAREVGLKVGDFIHTFGDAHIYHNHLAAVDEQLSRPYVLDPILPTIEILGDKSIFDLEPEDIVVHNYNPQGTIKAEVSK